MNGRNKYLLGHDMMTAAKAPVIERLDGLVGMFRLGSFSHYGHVL